MLRGYVEAGCLRNFPWSGGERRRRGATPRVDRLAARGRRAAGPGSAGWRRGAAGSSVCVVRGAPCTRSGDGAGGGASGPPAGGRGRGPGGGRGPTRGPSVALPPRGPPVAAPFTPAGRTSVTVTADDVGPGPA